MIAWVLAMDSHSSINLIHVALVVGKDQLGGVWMCVYGFHAGVGTSCVYRPSSCMEMPCPLDQFHQRFQESNHITV